MVAFTSFLIQFDGLVGPDGVQPADENSIERPLLPFLDKLPFGMKDSCRLGLVSAISLTFLLPIVSPLEIPFSMSFSFVDLLAIPRFILPPLA